MNIVLQFVIPVIFLVAGIIILLKSKSTDNKNMQMVGFIGIVIAVIWFVVVSFFVV